MARDRELEKITGRCPYCGGEVMDFMNECPHCHQPMPTDSEEMKHDRRIMKAHRISQLISVLCFIVAFIIVLLRSNG